MSTKRKSWQYVWPIVHDYFVASAKCEVFANRNHASNEALPASNHTHEVLIFEVCVTPFYSLILPLLLCPSGTPVLLNQDGSAEGHLLRQGGERLSFADIDLVYLPCRLTQMT